MTNGGLQDTQSITLFGLLINQACFHHSFFGALRTVTVGELGVRAFPYVSLHLFPPALLVTDLLALAADREK